MSKELGAGGRFDIFLDSVPVEIVLLVHYFFDDTHPRNRIYFWVGARKFSLINGCFLS